ncbi:MAG: PBP1A family penicillin-binding protein [bacterium]|nr:PBP1A family penicillin-binding protein [bacterium]
MDFLHTAIYLFVLLLIRIGDMLLLFLTLLTKFVMLLLSFCLFVGKSIIRAMSFILKGMNKMMKIVKKSVLSIGKRKKRTTPTKRVAADAKQPIPPHGKQSKFRYFFYGSIFSLFFFFLPASIYLFLQELPSPKALATRQIPQTTKIFSRGGTLLAQIYGPQDRTLVTLQDIPGSLKNATIAIEDKNFYTHPGFDVQAMLRAFRENVSGRSFQGASTITQQLVRSSFLTNETTVTRKLKEIIIAFWTERLYTKDQILEMYFNQVPYGGTAWGVEAASDVYFGKHVKEIDLAESAFLAGITTAPTLYSPFGQHPDLWKRRQKEVLQQMRHLGFITKEEEAAALSETLSFRRQSVAIHAPHFVNYIKEYLAQKYGLAMLEKGGLSVTTSIDLQIQEKAQGIVREEVDNARYLNLSNGALLVTNPKNGDILAMVGSRDFNDPNGGNVNVTTSLRQPGSSIKVVTYAAALTTGVTAATILDDSQVTYTSPGGPSYSPVNYDGRFHGKIPLRIALANSFNIPAVKLLNQIGIPTMVNLGKQMGIMTWGDPEKYGLSITLGAAEVKMVDMAEVYGTFANLGETVTLNPIIKITDYKEDVIEEKTAPFARRVLPTGVAFIISDILSDNQARTLEFGPNSPLQVPGHTVSVKTGTTDNKRDNWTIGYTPNILVATWVGNNDNSPMSQALASGITGAAPIWNRMMTYLLSGSPETGKIIPEDIVTKPCFGKIEYFLSGTEQNVTCRGWPTSPTVTIPQP